VGRRLDVPHNVKMTGIKFVPTSEWRVSLRIEECAERTWERDSGAPLVSLISIVCESRLPLCTE